MKVALRTPCCCGCCLLPAGAALGAGGRSVLPTGWLMLLACHGGVLKSHLPSLDLIQFRRAFTRATSSSSCYGLIFCCNQTEFTAGTWPVHRRVCGRQAFGHIRAIMS